MTKGGEQVILNLNATQALDVRDVFMKGLYNKLFDYIVRRINEALFRPSTVTDSISWNDKNDQKQTQKWREKRRFIGLLDIFGFEDIGFPHNNFEQLCINYASELIHQFFICQIFKHEQIEYEAQSINWKHMEYNEIDNLAILEMLAIQPLSIFSLINDESIFPQV